MNKHIEEIVSKFNELYVRIVPKERKDAPYAEILQKMYDAIYQDEKLKMEKFLRTSLRQIVEKAFEEIRVEQREAAQFSGDDTHKQWFSQIANHAIAEIEQKKKDYLSGDKKD